MSSSASPSTVLTSRGPEFALSTASDLAQFCLPNANRDENRKYAWACSISFLFIVIGCICIQTPLFVVHEPAPISEVVPVEFIQQYEPPPVEQQLQPTEDLEDITDAPVDMPQIAPVVVAADPTQVSFAVPVEGPVVVTTDFRRATAPPAIAPRAPPPPKPVIREFRPSSGEAEHSPQPTYPRRALEMKIEGVVKIFFIVDPGGAVTNLAVRESSGSSLLDEHTLKWVKERWRFPAGQERHFIFKATYQIR